MDILFLCKSNVFRSQMAEGFFNCYSKKHKAYSAALVSPQDKMHRLIVNAMKEEAIDISNNKSKMVSNEMLIAADIIIFMSKDLQEHLNYIREDAKSDAKIMVWDIPDIHAKETDDHLYPDFIKAKDIIKKKVLELISKTEK